MSWNKQFALFVVGLFSVFFVFLWGAKAHNLKEERKVEAEIAFVQKMPPEEAKQKLIRELTEKRDRHRNIQPW